jgi:hypothetical protein
VRQELGKQKAESKIIVVIALVHICWQSSDDSKGSAIGFADLYRSVLSVRVSVHAAGDCTYIIHQINNAHDLYTLAQLNHKDSA